MLNRWVISILVFLSAIPLKAQQHELQIAVVQQDSQQIAHLIRSGEQPHFMVADGEQEVLFLYQLLKTGEYWAVELMMQNGYRIPHKINGTHPLIQAVNNNWDQMVTFLIDHNYPVDIKNDYDFQALHYVARDGKETYYHQLIAAGAPIDALCNTEAGYFTPLMLASRNGYYAIALDLIKQGADPQYINAKGMSALQLATEQNQFWTRSLLLNVDHLTEVELCYTIASDNREEIKRFMDAKADHPIADGWSAVHFAARAGNLEYLQNLPSEGINFDLQKRDGFTPIMLAVFNNHFEMVKFFMEQNASPTLLNNLGKNIIDIANELNLKDIRELFYNPDKAIAQYELNQKLWKLLKDKDSYTSDINALLKEGADPNTYDNTFMNGLGYSIRNQGTFVTRMLLTYGAEPNVWLGYRNDKMYTPLMYAAYNGEMGLFRLLVEYGADSSWKNGLGNTAGSYARERQQHYILAYMADSNFITTYDLLQAAKKGNLEMLNRSIEQGADINYQDTLGNTPLQLACLAEKLYCVERLLQLGAKTDLKNKQGYSCFDQVLLNNQAEVAWMLLNHHAAIPHHLNHIPLQEALSEPKYSSMRYVLEYKKRDVIDFHKALKDQDLQLIDSFIEAGINVDIHVKQGFTPLQVALVLNRDSIFFKLMHAGADVNLLEGSGNSALHMAIYANNPEFFHLLITAGADSTRRTFSGEDNYTYALQNNSHHILRYFQDGNAYYKRYLDYKSFWKDIQLGDLSAVKSAIAGDKDPLEVNAKGENAFHQAILHQQSRLVSHFLDLGMDPNGKTQGKELTPLMLAAEVADTNLIALLVEHGADMDLTNKDGEDLIQYIRSMSLELQYLTQMVYNIVIRQLVAEKDQLSKEVLFLEARDGALDEVRSLVVDGTDVNLKDTAGWTALHYAARGGHHKVVEYLLFNQADPNAKLLRNGNTVLMEALYSGSIPAVYSLLRFADSSLQNKQGQTALQLAQALGNRDLIALLMGQDSIYEQYLFMQAVQENDLTSIKSHLDAGFSPNVQLEQFGDWRPIHYLVNDNHLRGVQLLLKYHVALNVNCTSGGTTYSPLMIAVYRDNPYMVHLLMEAGADVELINSEHKRAIDVAEEKDQEWNIDLLRQCRRAHEHYLHNQGLVDAYHFGYTFMIPELLEIHTNPKQKGRGGWTPLHFAARDNELEMAKTLIDLGARPNAQNDKGFTPLILAARNNHVAMIKLLQKAGADPAIKDTQNRSALDVAKEMNRAAAVAFLSGNDRLYHTTQFHQLLDKDDLDPLVQFQRRYPYVVNERGNFGFTALHWAARNGKVEAAKWLLQQGADPNLQTDSGWTPLILAAINDQTEIGYYLLKNQADPELTDSSERDVKDYAQELGHLSFVSLITSADSTFFHVQLLEKVNQYVLDNSNDQEEYRALVQALRQVKNINYTDNFHWNALFYAVRNNNLKACKLLVSKGINPEQHGAYDIGVTGSPLVIAARNDFFEIFYYLKAQLAPERYLEERAMLLSIAEQYNSFWVTHYLHQGEQIWDQYQYNQSIQNLLNSNEPSALDRLQELILDGADLNLPVEGNATPLYYVLRTHKHVFLDLLLKHSDVNSLRAVHWDEQIVELSPLMYATLHKNSQAIIKLLHAGARLEQQNPAGTTAEGFAQAYHMGEQLQCLQNPKQYALKLALRHALLEKDTALIQALLDDGADPSDPLAVIRSIDSKATNIIQMMFRAMPEAWQDASGKTAVHRLVTRYRSYENGVFNLFPYQVLKYILPHGSAVKQDTLGESAYSACQEDAQEFMLWYFDHPAEGELMVQHMTQLRHHMQHASQQNIIKYMREHPDILHFRSAVKKSWLTFALELKLDSVVTFLAEQMMGVYPVSVWQHPLEVMMDTDDTTLLHVLLDHGYQVDYLFKNDGHHSKSLLRLAIHKGAFECTKLLLAHGADPNLLSGNKYGYYRPLEICFKQLGLSSRSADDSTLDLRFVSALLGAGANPNLALSDDENPLDRAVEYNQKMLVQLLLEHSAHSNNSSIGWNGLHYAARDGELKFIPALLQGKADLNAIGTGVKYSPLMLAVHNENPAMILQLLEAGADPNLMNSEGETAIHMARASGNQSLIKCFLEPEQAKLDYHLQEAVATGDLVMLQKAIAKGAQLDQLNKEGQHLITRSVIKGNYKVVEQLLQHGGIPLNLQDKNGWTALHHCIDQEEDSMLNLLLEQGANPYLLDREGRTVMHLAVDRYRLSSVVVLLDQKVDPHRPNALGVSAVDLAKQKGYRWLHRQLRSEIPPEPSQSCTVLANGLDASKRKVSLEELAAYHQQLLEEFDRESPEYVEYLSYLIINLTYAGRTLEAYHLSEELIQMSYEVDGSRSKAYLEHFQLHCLLTGLIGEQDRYGELLNQLYTLTSSYYYSSHVATRKVAMQLATWYAGRSKEALAEYYFEEALDELNKEDHPASYAAYKAKYAQFKLTQGDTISYLSDAMEVIAILFDVSSSSGASTLVQTAMQLADFYFSKQQDSIGHHYYKAALAYVDSSEGKPMLQHSVHKNYAIELSKKGLYREAELHFNKALELTRTYAWGSKLDDDLYQYLRHLMRGNNPKAKDICQELNTLILNDLNLDFAMLSEAFKLAYLQSKRTQLDAIYTYAVSHSEEVGMAELLYTNSLRLKGILLESGKSVLQFISENSQAEDGLLYEEWLALKVRLAKLYALPEHRRLLDPKVLELRASRIEKELVKRARAQGMQWKHGDELQTVQSALKDGEAALEILHYTPRADTIASYDQYVALILRPEQSIKVIPLFRSTDVADQVIKEVDESNEHYVYDAYSRGVTVVDMEDIEEQLNLYDKVWQPMEHALQNVEHVYLSPSGLTHRIAFGAIPIDSNQSLIDRHSFSYVLSTRSIANQEAYRKPDRVQLIGGIIYDTDSSQLALGRGSRADRARSLDSSRGGSSWSYLHGTLDEVVMIKELLGNKGWNVQLLTGRDATEDSLKHMRSSASILHIATHGFFFPEAEDRTDETVDLTQNDETSVNRINLLENPLLRSGLLLSGANYSWTTGNVQPGKEDGILSAYEVSLMDFSNTDLVVLSACETGLGDIRGDEGVFGLQRAFKMAGAKGTIMSLWEVPDAQTAELMNAFYKNLLDGMETTEAFRAAQLQLKKKYDAYYWAAFVLMQ